MEISYIDFIYLVILDIHLYLFAYKFLVMYDVGVGRIRDDFAFKLNLETVLIVDLKTVIM